MDFKDDEGFLAEHKSRACKRCGSETHFTKDCTAPRLVTCHNSPGGGEWSSGGDTGGGTGGGDWGLGGVEELGALVQKNIQRTIPVFFDIQLVVEDE